MAKYIMSILKTQLMIMWSWGTSNFMALPNNEGLIFHVQGYKFKGWEYDHEIKPMLNKAMKVDNLRALCFWGEYDCLGVR